MSAKTMLIPFNHRQYTELMLGSSYWQRKERVASAQGGAENSSPSSLTIRGEPRLLSLSKLPIN